MKHVAILNISPLSRQIARPDLLKTDGLQLRLRDLAQALPRDTELTGWTIEHGSLRLRLESKEFPGVEEGGLLTNLGTLHA